MSKTLVIQAPYDQASYVISKRKVVTSNPWMLSLREPGMVDHTIGIYRTRKAAKQVALLLAGRTRGIFEER